MKIPTNIIPVLLRWCQNGTFSYLCNRLLSYSLGRIISVKVTGKEIPVSFRLGKNASDIVHNTIRVNREQYRQLWMEAVGQGRSEADISSLLMGKADEPFVRLADSLCLKSPRRSVTATTLNVEDLADIVAAAQAVGAQKLTFEFVDGYQKEVRFFTPQQVVEGVVVEAEPDSDDSLTKGNAVTQDCSS